MKTRQPSVPAPDPRFDIDSSLGRLAKWLRILGYDAAYPAKGPSTGRFFVTARGYAGHLGVIIVQSEDVLEQLRQVLDEIEARPDPDLFFSRCLLCNVFVEPVSREQASGRIPDEVLELAREFNECPKCHRIYWEGSHSGRVKARLKQAGIL